MLCLLLFSQTGITVLMNTFPTDRYVYMLCVVTGWWAQAGTTSRVFIYLCGRNGRSSRHALFDSSKKLFISGAENWFMLRTTHSLGRIKSVVVWHDNGGERPSWYVGYVLFQYHCLKRPSWYVGYVLFQYHCLKRLSWYVGYVLFQYHCLKRLSWYVGYVLFQYHCLKWLSWYVGYVLFQYHCLKWLSWYVGFVLFQYHLGMGKELS